MALNLSSIGKKNATNKVGDGVGVASRLVKDVVYDGYDFGILFTYFDGLSSILKGELFHGYYRHVSTSAYHRYWCFSRSVIDDNGPQLIEALCAASNGAVFEDWNEVSRSLQEAKVNVIPSAFTVDMMETIYPLNIGGVAIVGSYHSGVVSICKDMGGRYLPPMKAWKIIGASAAALKNNLLVELDLRDEQIIIADGLFNLDMSSQQQDGARPTICTLNNKEPESVARIEDGDNEIYLAVAKPRGLSTVSMEEIEASLDRYQLYPFQRLGVKHLASSTSAALFDDMGLGKSRQAVVAADIVATNDDDMILIACPASLIINWSREIAMICPDDLIVQQAFDPKARWVVTNYERLNEMIQHAGRFKVMITDEAHLLKEPSALRTQYAFEIGAKVQSLFILTGTPILNREAEIHTLLRLSGHPLGNTPLKEFEQQFAGDPAFRVELNKRIGEWMLRRKKDLVLTQLKGKNHQVVFVNPSAEKRALYDATANDTTLLALPKIGRLRMLLESIKVESVMEMIAETRSDDKFLIFCEFKENVAEFKSRFDALGIGAVTLVGNHSIQRRQKAVDQFQQDPDTRGFIGTTAAAGVGNTLTAANYVIFASLPWTPALKDQAEDRAYRIGQNRLVMVKIPLLENSIDIDLWEMLRHKSSVAADVLDPESAVAQESAAEATFAIAWAKRPSAGAVPLPMLIDAKKD